MFALLILGMGVPQHGKHRLITSGGGAGPSIGAHISNATANATSLTTSGITTQASGSSFWVCVNFGPSLTASVSDNEGNTYTQDGTNLTFAGLSILARYRKVNGTGGASHTWTVTPSATSFLSIWAVEIKNSTGGLDQQNAANTSSSPFDSPAVTTGTANEVLLGCAVDNSTLAGDNFTAGLSFTLLDQVTDGSSLGTGASAGRVVSATGTYKSEFTSVQGTSMAVSIDTFK